MQLSLYFMPAIQIGHMSLNDLRRQVANRNKTQKETRMDEPLVALDLCHRVSASGAPSMSFRQPKKHFLEYLQH
jgi:hypothetical protein